MCFFMSILDASFPPLACNLYFCFSKFIPELVVSRELSSIYAVNLAFFLFQVFRDTKVLLRQLKGKARQGKGYGTPKETNVLTPQNSGKKNELIISYADADPNRSFLTQSCYR